MLKYSSILLLVAVAISCSQVECRHFNGRYARLFASGIAKRQAEDDIDALAVAQENRVKKLLASLVRLTDGNSSEQLKLSQRFEKEMKNKHDSVTDYADNLATIYKEVTGRDPDESLSSQSDES